MSTTYEGAEAAADRSRLRSLLAGAHPTSYWLDGTTAEQAPALAGDTTADLVVVGGGFTGLWTALHAKRRDPSRDVLLLEGRTCGWAASGRNGGFLEPSLTHGRANGEARLPAEVDLLDTLGSENLRDLCAEVDALGIDCDLERVGSLDVAVEAHEVSWLSGEPGFLTQDEVGRVVASPLYLAAVRQPGTVLMHPGKLVRGLRQACLDAGVRIHEHTPVARLRADSGRERLTTPTGTVTARQVALATNAFRPLLRRSRWHTVPVWDYAIVTEPLTAGQLAEIGWAGREGLADLANRFHYYRLTPDDRILFGGYDAVHPLGRDVSDSRGQRAASFERLLAHLHATFPSVRDVPVSHAWGGAIDTCTRFFCFFEHAHEGRVVQAIGFTGLGTAAARFAADVMLDLLAGEDTVRTRLELVRSRPTPFPPEPLAWAGIQLTTRALVKADRNQGRRGLWLRTLDRLGLGFDS